MSFLAPMTCGLIIIALIALLRNRKNFARDDREYHPEKDKEKEQNGDEKESQWKKWAPAWLVAWWDRSYWFLDPIVRTALGWIKRNEYHKLVPGEIVATLLLWHYFDPWHLYLSWWEIVWVVIGIATATSLFISAPWPERFLRRALIPIVILGIVLHGLQFLGIPKAQTSVDPTLRAAEKQKMDSELKPIKELAHMIDEKSQRGPLNAEEINGLEKLREAEVAIRRKYGFVTLSDRWGELMGWAEAGWEKLPKFEHQRVRMGSFDKFVAVIFYTVVLVSLWKRPIPTLLITSALLFLLSQIDVWFYGIFHF